jgi:hypothetical protein
MNDNIWTTETEDAVVGSIQSMPSGDDEQRAEFHEQMMRRLEVLNRQERQREREEMVNWQEAERDLRNRALRANWPEPPRDRRETEVERKRETIGFLQDFLNGRVNKEKKEEKILKPLPDKLFEID